MSEASSPRVAPFAASDGYRLHRLVWPTETRPRARLIVLHGVQSHGGWYHGLGQRLARAGFETHFPDRRGSGANREARGHAPSWQRLTADVTELAEALRSESRDTPVAVAGISWGGKLAVVAAAQAPQMIDALALICPGLHPRVGVPLGERLRIALAMAVGRAATATFAIPLSDPALFTASPEGQAFIAADPLSLHAGTAGLMASSFFLDRAVARVPAQIRQPALLMLAGQDRIVHNDRTRAFFDRLASPQRQLIEYPEGHHTLEFDPDPERYALDLAAWLERALPGR